MILNLNNLSKNIIESTLDDNSSRSMSMSKNAEAMVFQMFTKSVYSNPIGTVVREITSNCFDSHSEANVNAPILIKKWVNTEEKTTYLSFQDYGVGMSPERMYDIYGVYFESTKSGSNELIGGFGIGGKTPLAYKRQNGVGSTDYDNSFYIVTNYDGIRYYYCIYEGASKPIISLLHKEETTERNGTEVRIPILVKDTGSFAKEMVKQLYYFEGIVFEGFNDTFFSDTLANDFQIVRGKNFLFRGNDYSNNMHVVLGRVAYPINYDVLGLDSSDYEIPIGVKFDIGEINVIVSREAIDYSENTIKMIKAKLEAAKDEVIELITKQYDNVETITQYFAIIHDFGVLAMPNGKSINLKRILKNKKIKFNNFKYNTLTMYNDADLFNLFFDIESYGKKIIGWRNQKQRFTGSYENIFKFNNLLYVEDDFNRVVLKQSYLKSLYETYYIIRRTDLVNKEFDAIEAINMMFNVRVNSLYDLNGNRISEFQILLDMQDEYFDIITKKCANYDTLVVPDDFIIKRAARGKMSDSVRKSTIPVRLGNNNRERISMDELMRYKMPIIYATYEDETKFREMYTIYRLLFDEKNIVNHINGYSCYFETMKSNINSNNKQSILFILISKSNLKYMKYCKNTIHVNQFYNKMLYRKADMLREYFSINKIYDKYNDLYPLYKDNNFVLVNENWGNLINDVKERISLISLNYKDNKISHNYSLLSRYYDLTNLTKSKKILELEKNIETLQLFERENNKIIDCLSVTNLKYVGDTMIEIMKKVMIF